MMRAQAWESPWAAIRQGPERAVRTTPTHAIPMKRRSTLDLPIAL
jgi:hypothetical protein